jgi:hypothetical protein
LREIAHGALELLLFVGEREVHVGRASGAPLPFT